MSAFTRALTFALAISTTGCSTAVWEGVAAGLQGASTGMSAAPSSTKLMLFGGPGHKTYLGCLSCNEYASDSVFNTFGSHGSSYSASSVLNSYGQYGSPYSAYSACNPYASDPPVIVDQNGNFYGRLTVNEYNSQRTNMTSVLAWLEAVCND